MEIIDTHHYDNGFNVLLKFGDDIYKRVENHGWSFWFIVSEGVSDYANFELEEIYQRFLLHKKRKQKLKRIINV